MSFILRKESNKLSLRNIGGSGPITIKVYTQDTEAEDFGLPVEVIVPVGLENAQTYTMVENNLYRIVNTDDGETQYVYYNPTFLKSIIRSVKNNLCSCNCLAALFPATSGLGNLISKMSVYLVRDNVPLFVSHNLYAFTSEPSCLLNSEKLTGSFNYKDVNRKIIAIYYLTILLRELRIAQDTTVVKDLFEYSEISICIKQLGIDPKAYLDGRVPVDF